MLRFAIAACARRRSAASTHRLSRCATQSSHGRAAQPKKFQSSNSVSRGFCGNCGTPLTYEAPDGIALAIGAFDTPEKIAPKRQWGVEAKLPYVDHIHELPAKQTLDDAVAAHFLTQPRFLSAPGSRYRRMASGMTELPRKLTSVDDLIAEGLVPEAARTAMTEVGARYAIAITPDIASLIDRSDANDPMARQFVPDARELEAHTAERDDPIGDRLKSPAPGIVHRYPDRVLLKIASVCPGLLPLLLPPRDGRAGERRGLVCG